MKSNPQKNQDCASNVLDHISKVDVKGSSLKKYTLQKKPNT